MQGLKDKAQRTTGVLTSLPPDLKDWLKHQAIDRITQNADGDWMVDGEICRCSLGAHEGMARARLMAKQYQEADTAGRERLLKEWA